jgi:hypothetical protein
MRLAVECPCCHGAKRLTVIEHDEEFGRTVLSKPVCTHCMGVGTVTAEDGDIEIFAQLVDVNDRSMTGQ